MARCVFKVLCDAREPLCAREVALRIMAAKALDPDDSALAGLFTQRVVRLLHNARYLKPPVTANRLHRQGVRPRGLP